MNRSTQVAVLFLSLITAACETPPDELLTKSYTYEQLQTEVCGRPKRCVEGADEVWFLEAGFLFRYDKTKRTKEFIEGSSNLKELVGLKGHLVGLQNDGSVYLTVDPEEENQYFGATEIGSSIKSIVSDGQDLVALTSDGGILTFKTPRGPLNIVLKKTTSLRLVGKILVPHTDRNYFVDGREIELRGTSITGVSRIYLKAGKIRVDFENGEGGVYRR